MAHHYKLKDKKIAIWYWQTEKVNGVNVKKWIPRIEGKIWAYFKQTGGSLNVSRSNDLVVHHDKELATFTINNRSDLTVQASDIIVYDKRIYTVLVVDRFEGYKEDIKLNVELAEDQKPENYNGLIIE